MIWKLFPDFPSWVVLAPRTEGIEGKSLQIMKIDFHVHSCYSFDCFLEPAAIVANARRLGIDGLAVTDHDTMEGVEAFRRCARGLYIIAGQEISTPQGDVLGLFLREPVEPAGTLDDILADIRGQGGLAVLAHPFKWPYMRRGDAILRKFDALESLNARNNIPMPWWPNAQGRAACARLGLPGIAGSDAHGGFEMGAVTVFGFPAAGATDAKIKEAVLAGRFRVEGREVSLAREVVSHFKRLIRERRLSRFRSE